MEALSFLSGGGNASSAKYFEIRYVESDGTKTDDIQSPCRLDFADQYLRGILPADWMINM